MAYQTPLTVKEALDRVGQGRLVLPAIQREFVWVSDTDRMTRLFDSLLRKYPIGTFLFWDVPANQSQQFDFYEVMRVWHERDRRHNPRVELRAPRDLTAVLDGQQRLTTLNIGLHGSIAQRAKYKRATSMDAYPLKQLYVDLRFTPDEDDDIEYRFAFLTVDQAAADKGAHWYRAGDITGITGDAGLPILRYLRSHDLTDDERAYEVLYRLWTAVHQDGVISAFEERGEELSRVLDIFVRVNSGGVVLSKSDLLLSMATAHFRSRDAREEIHQLVDELNAEGGGFTFSKDLVLKAGLVLTGISDIGFRVENFTTANMAHLEANWDRLADALRVAVRLLASFGFSGQTPLPANSVLIPLADYVYDRGHGQGYLDSEAANVRADRQALRHWTLRTVLMPGIWGSALDGLLRGLHRAIVDSTGPFPVPALEAEMARRGKALDFNDTLLDELVETPYKHPRAFALLALLYETAHAPSRPHVDHVFPRALATRSKLVGAGVEAATVDTVRDKVERLPNLQLLHGPANIDKRAQLPAAWAAGRFPDPTARAAWLAANDLLGLPETFTGFQAFYDRRRDLMRTRIAGLLGAARRPAPAPGALLEPAVTPPPLPQPAGPLEPPDAPTTPGSSPRTRVVFEEKLADLIADGRLRVGEVLYADHRGRRHEATVERDGLRVDGRLFDDPSPAGRVGVTDGVQVNGWKLWTTADGRPLGTLRRR